MTTRPAPPPRCSGRVHDGGASVRFHQCRRNAVLGPCKDGHHWCRQHAPRYLAAAGAETVQLWCVRLYQGELQTSTAHFRLTPKTYVLASERGFDFVTKHDRGLVDRGGIVDARYYAVIGRTEGEAYRRFASFASARAVKLAEDLAALRAAIACAEGES